MEVKYAKASVNGSPVLADLKRKRAVRCAAYFTGTEQPSTTRATLSRPAIKRRRILRSDGYESGGKCYFETPVLKNYENFKKSGLPQRVLFYNNGEWNDFSASVINLIREAFQLEKFITEIMFKGHHYLVDFLRMVQIDLKTGLQQSIAWIDVSGRFFFPELSLDFDGPHDSFGFDGANGRAYESCKPNGTREIKVHLEIGINGEDCFNAEKCDEDSSSHVNKCEVQEKLDGNCNMEHDCSSKEKPSTEIKETILEDCPRAVAVGEPKVSSPRICTIGSRKSGFESGKLVQLFTGGSDYNAVQKIFLFGFGPLSKEIDIVGIFHNSLANISLQAQLQSFRNQVEMTKMLRGNANVRIAWFGSSREALMRIMSHGFGINEKSKTSPSYETMISLTPGSCSLLCANYCDVDENGIQHMLLCRVIMGKMELIRPGSEQFHLISEEFDSGVDDIENPKHYIIRNMHMSTHIYPEYLVSFKVPSSIKGYWSGMTSDQSKSNESGITNSINHHNEVQRNSFSIDLMGSRDQVPHVVKQSQEKAQGLSLRTPKVPTSAWMTLPMLFALISDKISAEAKRSVHLHYNDFKSKKISRDDLIKKLRFIIGDPLLKSTLQSLQRKNVSHFNISSGNW